MPNRFLREGLLTSASFNDLSVEIQVFYVRLLLLADDFGAYDGRENVIASRAYPTTSLTQEKVERVSAMLRSLHEGGMIIRYSNKGRPYIAILQWGNDLRGNRKYPAPPVDVDLEGYKLRGMYGRPIGWRNPAGSDNVSILIDIHGRAAVPQPDEWRPPSHYIPVTKVPNDYQPVTGKQSLEVSAQSLSTSDRQQEVELELEKELELVKPVAVVADDVKPLMTTNQSLESVNGDPHITLDPNGGGWVGLTEAQRLRWQGMFDDVSIPDQCDRAAEWIRSNPVDRAAYDRGERGGYYRFLVRWLLREVRPKP